MNGRDIWADAPTLQLSAVSAQPAPAQIEVEVGTFSNLTIGPNSVTKQRKRSYGTREVALQHAQALIRYADMLHCCGVPVAKLLRAEPKRTADGYTVEHEVELVGGVGFNQLPPHLHALRRDAARRMVEVVARMPAQEYNDDVLKVGIDAATRNWRIDRNTGELKMVDFDPPLIRDQQGRLIRPTSQQDITYFERMCGTRSGAIAHILITAYQFPPQLMNQPDGATAFVANFTDIVPAQMHEHVADAIDEYHRVMLYQGLGNAAHMAAGLPPQR